MDPVYEEYYGKVERSVCEECEDEIEPGEEVVFPGEDGKDWIYCKSCMK